MKRRIYENPRIIGLLIILILIAIGVLDWTQIGRPLDVYRDAKVYHNGFLYFRSHGRNYAPDGYYLGQKWQCVEFVKRFYHKAFHHRMPNAMGNAKDFFDPALAHRGFNKDRGMNQFQNGADEPPMADDLLVFRDGTYGHVAIISEVTIDAVEIVQQNILARPRQRLKLRRAGNKFFIEADRPPSGWLRLPDRN